MIKNIHLCYPSINYAMIHCYGNDCSRDQLCSCENRSDRVFVITNCLPICLIINNIVCFTICFVPC